MGYIVIGGQASSIKVVPASDGTGEVVGVSKEVACCKVGDKVMGIFAQVSTPGLGH